MTAARWRIGAIAAALLGTACAATDVVVAELAEDDAGSAADASCDGPECNGGHDHCRQPDCTLPDACDPRPDTCDDDLNAVCGCDGITYWNDCLRRQNGVPASTRDPCHDSAVTCDVDDDCGPGAVCAHLVPYGSRCSEPQRATCWVLPTSCPSFDPDTWVPCGRQYARCVDTCRAIRSGELHRHAGQCP